MPPPPARDDTVEDGGAVLTSAAAFTATATATAWTTEPPVASAVALFPPRPDAILTFLPSDDFLPGTQTLLYSLKRTSDLTGRLYPPEVVVMVSRGPVGDYSAEPAATKTTISPVHAARCRRLVDAGLCTRIVTVDDWPVPLSHDGSTLTEASLQGRDDPSPGWTKLQMFGLQQYDSILYIDSDCLVLRDVTHLLDLGKVYTESDALVAAAPDVGVGPGRFDSGVMVLRPSREVYSAMLDRSMAVAAAPSAGWETAGTTWTTCDQSVTDFLNEYFPTWSTEFPPTARLSLGYNAQQAWHDSESTTASKDGTLAATGNGTGTETGTGGGTFWDVQVAPNLHIVHYSNPVKPWQKSQHGSPPTEGPLSTLFRTWYKRSHNFVTRMEREAKQQQQQRKEAQATQASSAPSVAAVTPTRRPQQLQQTEQALHHNDPRQIHRLIQKRFKALRSQGVPTKEAMQQARDELQPHSDKEDVDVGSQVAAMFGMR